MKTNTQAMLPELKKKLTRSSWTPGKKDISVLLENWLTFDETERAQIEKALAKIDPLAIERIVHQWSDVSARTRADWARPLGRAILKNQHEATLSWLVKTTTNEKDPRTRKGFIQAMGAGLQSKDFKNRPIIVEALLTAAQRQDLGLPEIKALTDALGKSGDKRAAVALSVLAGQGGEVSKSQMILERDTARGSESDNVSTDLGALMDDAKGVARNVVLWFVPGLEKLARRSGAFAGAEPLGEGVLLVESANGAAVRENLLWRDAGVVLGAIDICTATAVAQLVSGAEERLRKSMQGLAGDGKIRVRLDHTNIEVDAGKTIGPWEFAQALSKENSGVINDGRDCHFQIDVVKHGPVRLVVAMPKKFIDPRWTWRGAQELEGSSQSTIAAAIVNLARPKANDRVWDPFCGAGTELFIAARSLPEVSALKLFGTDINVAAITSATKKATELKIPMELRQVDALTISEKFSMVITNPPFGMRTARGEARGILEALFGKMRARLTNGGRFVLLSHAPAATAGWGRDAGLRLVESIPIRLGGMSCELQRFE